MAASLVIAQLLDTWLGKAHISFVPVFAALVLVGWRVGLGPALLALLLAGIYAVYELLPTVGNILVVDMRSAIGLAVFLIAGSACALLGQTIFYPRRRREDGPEQGPWWFDEFLGSITNAFFQVKSARAEARRQKRLYQSITDNASVALFIMDAQQRCTFMNPAAEQLTGYTLKETSGRPLHDVVHHTRPDGTPYPLSECPIDRAFPEQNRMQGEEVFVHKNGHFYYVAFTASPIRDETGTPIGTIIEVQDISERKQQEAALRESENRLRLAQSGGRVGVWDWAAQNNSTYWSSTMWELYGRSPIEDACEVRNIWRDSLHPLDRQRVMRRVDQCLHSADTDFREEYRIVLPDQSQRWIQSVAKVERDGTNAAVRMSGVNIDITARKRAELLEREQSRVLELIASGSPMHECLLAISDAVTQLEPGARAAVIMANPEGTRIVNCFSTTLAHDFCQRVEGLPIDETSFGTCGTAIFSGQTIACEDIPGSVQWSPLWKQLCLQHGILACQSTPVLGAGGKAVASFFVCFDQLHAPDAWEQRLAEFGAHAAGIVLERDRVASALLNSEARERYRAQLLQAILDTSPTPIWYSLDPDCQTIYGNPASEKLLGLPAGSNVSLSTIADLPGSYRCLRHGVEVAPAHLPMQRAASQRTTVQGEEYEIVRADGHHIWLLMHASPLIQDDKVSGAVAVAMDITERKSSELAMRHSEESLREADRRKDEFLATLAHELRNPLAPVLNSLHILRANSLVERQQVLDMMERQITHMVRLVDDLLEVSRITRGKIELRKEIMDLKSAIRSAIETATPAITAGKHQLLTDLPTEPVMLEADPVRVAQIIGNLLNNAAKYTEQGGQILLRAYQEQEMAYVSVRDTGVGIPVDMLPKVFDLFTQVDSTLGRSQGGLGIGLALVRSLARLHGGDVVAHSDGPGTGSQFTVSLPMALISDEAVVQNAPKQSTAPFKGRSVLVVDDNRDAAESLALLLRIMGADVHVAYCGPTALELLRAHHPNVVLLDIGMPGMDGYAVASQVRQQPEMNDVTLVALTGWGQEEDRRRSKQAGFDLHLTKPPEIKMLEQLLGRPQLLDA